MHLVGHTREGFPIIYSCLELAGNRVFEDNRAHMIQTFEMVRRALWAFVWGGGRRAGHRQRGGGGRRHAACLLAVRWRWRLPRLPRAATPLRPASCLLPLIALHCIAPAAFLLPAGGQVHASRGGAVGVGV